METKSSVASRELEQETPRPSSLEHHVVTDGPEASDQRRSETDLTCLQGIAASRLAYLPIRPTHRTGTAGDPGTDEPPSALSFHPGLLTPTSHGEGTMAVGREAPRMSVGKAEAQHPDRAAETGFSFVAPCLHTIDEDAIQDHLARDHFFWVDLTDPSSDDVERLHDIFGFHPLALEDALHFGQRPKLDHY